MPDFTTLLTDIIANHGYFAIYFAMILEGMCLPVPSELVLGFAGFLVYQNRFLFLHTVLAGWLGSLTGSMLVFGLARFGGRRLLYRWGHLIRLEPQLLDKISVWFERFGPVIIIPWRQAPFIRTRISVFAGLLDMRPLPFLLHTTLGIFIWCTMMVAVGEYLGYHWSSLLHLLTALGKYVSVLFMVIALFGACYLAGDRKIKRSARSRPLP